MKIIPKIYTKMGYKDIGFGTRAGTGNNPQLIPAPNHPSNNRGYVLVNKKRYQRSGRC